MPELRATYAGAREVHVPDAKAAGLAAKQVVEGALMKKVSPHLLSVIAIYSLHTGLNAAEVVSRFTVQDLDGSRLMRCNFSLADVLTDANEEEEYWFNVLVKYMLGDLKSGEVL